MKFSKKHRWRIIRDYCIGWTVAFIFLSIVRGIGTNEDGHFKFDFLSSLLISFTLGPLLGIVSGYAHIITYERAFKRIPMSRLLLIRLAYTLCFIVILALLAYVIYRLYFDTSIGFIAFAFDPGSFSIYFYVIVVSFFLSLLSQVNMMLGNDRLKMFMQGKFYDPREEERIFMFLDLRASTALAEQLGHIAYSRMIQDCFNDISVVLEQEAEIYQYVGDEVILTWKLHQGLKHQNCLKAYYCFMDQLASRRTYYKQNYQAMPFFKAGVHAGTVTVTEVGQFKREIAYHGDTINTAARIQGKCNEFDQGLLISEDLKEQLSGSGYQFTRMGDIPLKGKASNVTIFGVQRVVNREVQ